MKIILHIFDISVEAESDFVESLQPRNLKLFSPSLCLFSFLLWLKLLQKKRKVEEVDHLRPYIHVNFNYRRGNEL